MEGNTESSQLTVCLFASEKKNVVFDQHFHTTVNGSEIRRENQLRLVVCPIICRVSYIPGGARFQPLTVVYRRFEASP